VADGDGGAPFARVIGGGGDDQFTLHSGGIRLYDDKGQNRAEGGGINTKEWKWKPDSANSTQLAPRDWGHKTFLLLTGYFATDMGAVIDYGGFTDKYGFRSIPYATRLDYRAQYSTEQKSARFIGGFTNQFENSKGFWRLDVLASGIETLRWYGLGNETVQNGNRAFYKVSQTQLGAGLKLARGSASSTASGSGPRCGGRTPISTASRTTRGSSVTDEPYGTGQFGMAGVTAELRLDGRDFPGFASKGIYMFLKGSAYPKAWDLEEAFGRVEGEASLALAPQGKWRPSLTLFAGGSRRSARRPSSKPPASAGSGPSGDTTPTGLPAMTRSTAQPRSGSLSPGFVWCCRDSRGCSPSMTWDGCT
jgi:hypothetical protein